MKGGRGEWEGAYEGAEAFGRRTFGNLGKEALLEIRDSIFWWVIFWFGV
jgi:hypothetical protein